MYSALLAVTVNQPNGWLLMLRLLRLRCWLMQILSGPHQERRLLLLGDRLATNTHVIRRLDHCTTTVARQITSCNIHVIITVVAWLPSAANHIGVRRRLRARGCCRSRRPLLLQHFWLQDLCFLRTGRGQT